MGATRSARRGLGLAITLVVVGGCASHAIHLGQRPRPSELAAEWVDVRHTSAGDTALWVLRADGYDGAARLVLDPRSTEASMTRSDRRYGSWYLDGDLADGSHRALCFAHRIGRDGATCLSFQLDTIVVGGLAHRRLVIHNYRGQHTTMDRELIERMGRADRREGREPPG